MTIKKYYMHFKCSGHEEMRLESNKIVPSAAFKDFCGQINAKLGYEPMDKDVCWEMSSDPNPQIPKDVMEKFQ